MYGSTLEVSVSSIYPYTLEVFHQAYGGTLSTRRRSTNCRQLHEWRIYGKSAEALIEDVLPYLKEKRGQALICLEIRTMAPGPSRDGLVAQLKSMKRIEYRNEEEKETEHPAD